MTGKGGRSCAVEKYGQWSASVGTLENVFGLKRAGWGGCRWTGGETGSTPPGASTAHVRATEGVISAPFAWN